MRGDYLKMITGEQLKGKFKLSSDKTAHALAETLREFGYQTVTDDEVKKMCQSIVNNDPPQTNDVVYMFLLDWFTHGVD